MNDAAPQYKRLIIPFIISVSFITLSLSVFLLLAAPARAIDCNVPSGSYATIQSAVDDNSCDTIIVMAGTFMENVTIARNVTINGAGSTSTVIDANGASRGITIDGAGIVVYLNDLRVTNGDATSGPSVGDRNGGGIYVTNGATLHGNYLQVDNNLASTSTVGFGGGIAVNAGSAYITNTLILSNTAARRDSNFTGAGRGGGLYLNNDAFMSVTDSQIRYNVAAYRAAANQGAAGGGLFVQENSQVSLQGNIWEYNVARGEASVECPFSTCNSGLDTEGGGAIGAHVSSSGAAAVIDITGDTFSYNTGNDVAATSANSGRGGAISLNTSNTGAHITATLRYVTMSHNIAARAAHSSGEMGQGGAVYARHTALEFEKSTLIDNLAATAVISAADGYGGGVYIREPEIGDYLTVTNSIVSSNEAAGAVGTGAQIYINYTTSSQNSAAIIHSTIADDAQNSHTAVYYNGPTVGDSLWLGNTIIVNHAVGVHNVNAPGGARARYLLFDGNGQNQLIPGSTAFPAGDDTTWVTGDPKFVDAASGNYHIQSDSAAVDSGGNEVEIISPTDIDDEPRPYNLEYDIGADEFIPTELYTYLPTIIGGN